MRVRAAKLPHFLHLVLLLLMQANGQKCGFHACDSAIVADIRAKNDNAIRIEKITFGIGNRIDTLILDDDVLKSNKVRTAVGIHRIVDLSELEYLDLNIHWLDTIPDDLDKLEKLETLIIRIPQIKALPARIFEIATLRKLDLEGCKITTLSEEIGNLADLEYLSLYASDLVSLPASIGDLVHLRYLNLADNELSGFPSSVFNLRNLDTLHCWYNRLCALDPNLETWVDSVEVYAGWKGSQICGVRMGTAHAPRLLSGNNDQWQLFDALGKECGKSTKSKANKAHTLFLK